MSEHNDPESTQLSAEGHSPLFSRRLWLGNAMLLAAAGGITRGAMAESAAAPDDLAKLQTMLRLQASLGPAMVPWFYTGRIYAVRSGKAPLHLYDFEGTEIYWVRAPVDNRWTIAASTLTFYRDVATGAYLDEFTNPITGTVLKVQPNVLRTRPGGEVVYTPAGMLVFGQTLPWNIHLYRNGDLQWLTTSRGFAGGPQPSLEVQTMFGSYAELSRSARKQVAAHFSSTTFSPWSAWLQMGDTEGHQIWHAAGRKLISLDEAPADYRARADALGSKHFTDPGAA